MDGRLRDGEVRLGGDARQRFYDSRGYGRPAGDGDLALARVEAAHLLFRGDIDAVDGMGFREFLAAGGEGFVTRFLVYKDLRDRGFYLSPVREGEDRADDPGGADFVVYPRGQGPWDGEVKYRVAAVSERSTVAADDLGDVVLAVVDEESEITYLETDLLAFAGDPTPVPESATGSLLDDRVVVWDPPEALHGGAFFGQPFGERDGDGADAAAVQLSLVESAYLAARGALVLADGDGVEAVVSRGRAVEGERFDRRLRAYRALRDGGSVPKTGFKFGADFRVYGDGLSPDEVGHAAHLVRVLPDSHGFAPRDLALDVRLAHGVRKEMVFARPDGDRFDWLVVGRLTP